ncbi:hypothetical protein D3C75_755900 [compost metagenome]
MYRIILVDQQQISLVNLILRKDRYIKPSGISGCHTDGFGSKHIKACLPILMECFIAHQQKDDSPKNPLLHFGFLLIFMSKE